MDENTVNKILLMHNVSSITFHSPSGDPNVPGENWAVVFFEDANTQAVPLRAILAVRNALPAGAECEIQSTWERDVQMNVWIPEVA